MLSCFLCQAEAGTRVKLKKKTIAVQLARCSQGHQQWFCMHLQWFDSSLCMRTWRMMHPFSGHWRWPCQPHGRRQSLAGLEETKVKTIYLTQTPDHKLHHSVFTHHPTSMSDLPRRRRQPLSMTLSSRLWRTWKRGSRVSLNATYSHIMLHSPNSIRQYILYYI